jgi:hypothetical protein
MKRDDHVLPRQKRAQDKHAVYEALKQALPAMPPEEYEAACRKLADELGL